mmetsp:Transcript_8637/g.15612  ORF Transcript_8637/g.15612 Transcript_8637/m.15612 type:complete len:164 (-) Transcript_8637:714-1205(-)
MAAAATDVSSTLPSSSVISESDLISGVTESWSLLLQKGADVSTAFYGLLFERYPSVRSMFPDEISDQKAKLAKTLDWLVKNLSNLDDVVATVRALGKRHAKYGVVPEQFDAVGECLLETVKNALGESAPRYTVEGWTYVYGIVSKIAKESCAEEIQLSNTTSS